MKQLIKVINNAPATAKTTTNGAKEGNCNCKCQHCDKHKHKGGDKNCWELEMNATNDSANCILIKAKKRLMVHGANISRKVAAEYGCF